MGRTAAWIALWMAGCQAEVGGDDPAVEPFWPAGAPVFAEVGEDGAVTSVDVDRYLGSWFEIATFPIPFQRACTGSTATYGLLEEEVGLSVRNWCALESLDGTPYEIVGRALPDDDAFATLRVSFFGDFFAPYWVIERDDASPDGPYRWAIVSDPSQDTLWILSRTPKLPEAVLDALLERLEDRGYDLSGLSYTEQPDEPLPDQAPDRRDR